MILRFDGMIESSVATLPSRPLLFFFVDFLFQQTKNKENFVSRTLPGAGSSRDAPAWSRSRSRTSSSSSSAAAAAGILIGSVVRFAGFSFRFAFRFRVLSP